MGVISLCVHACVCLCAWVAMLWFTTRITAELQYQTKPSVHLPLNCPIACEQDTEKQYVSVWTLLSAVFFLKIQHSPSCNNNWGRRRQRPQVVTASRWVVICVTGWVKKKRERVRGQQRGCEGRRERDGDDNYMSIHSSICRGCLSW